MPRPPPDAHKHGALKKKKGEHHTDGHDHHLHGVPIEHQEHGDDDHHGASHNGHGSSADDTERLASTPGSLNLSFSMLRLVFQEISDRLSVLDSTPLSENENSTIEELAAELQRLAATTKAGASSGPEDAGAAKSLDDQDNEDNGSGGEDEVLEDWQEELVNVFREVDHDHSGQLSTAELRKALEAAEIPRARLIKVIAIADKDRSGEIDMKEWLRAIKDPECEMRQISQRLSVKQQESGTIWHEETEKCKFMIDPSNKFRMVWDLIISFMCFYISIGLPFSISFEDRIEHDVVDIMKVVDRTIDYILLADVALNFRTGFYNSDGETVMDGRKAAYHYARTWFLLDFLSSFPFSDVSSGKMMDLQVAKLLKLGKLMKVLKVLRPRSLDMAEISDILEDIMQSKMLQMFYRRGKVGVYMILLCHWMACGFKYVDEGHLREYQDVYNDLWREYLASMYWSVTTLTTVGYGDITPTSDGERLYTIVAMVIGGAFYGYIVGSITTIVANNDLNSSAYYDRMDLIHAWLVHHRLPMQMKRTLRRYFKAYLMDKSAVSEADIWHDLSPELQKDVGEYIVHEDVKNNPLFDGMNVGTVVRLQSILQRVTILAGRIVTTNGEAGTAMYIISSGSVEQDDGEHVNVLGPGQSFGEEILLGIAEQYTYRTMVVEKAKFEMILEDEFLNLFQTMPNVLERMRNNAIELNPKWKDVMERD